MTPSEVIDALLKMPGGEEALEEKLTLELLKVIQELHDAVHQLEGFPLERRTMAILGKVLKEIEDGDHSESEGEALCTALSLIVPFIRMIKEEQGWDWGMEAGPGKYLT